MTNWTAIRRRSPILSILQTRAIRLKLAASKDLSESNRGTLKRQTKALPGGGQYSGFEHIKAAPVEEMSTIRPREGVSSILCEKCTGQRYRSLRSLLFSAISVIGAPTLICKAQRRLFSFGLFVSVLVLYRGQSKDGSLDNFLILLHRIFGYRLALVHMGREKNYQLRVLLNRIRIPE